MGDNFSIFCKRILKEMSAKAMPIKEPSSFYQDKWKNNKHQAEFIEDYEIHGQDFKVYSISLGEYIQLFFIQNDIVFIFLEFMLESDDGISMLYMWKVGAIGPLMPDLFRDYLLKHFKYIKSDSTHTPQGFNVYYNLAHDTKHIDMSVIDDTTGKIIPVNDGNELRKYYGGVADEKYKFIVKLK